MLEVVRSRGFPKLVETSVQTENYHKALEKARSSLLSTLPRLVQYSTQNKNQTQPEQNQTTGSKLHLITVKSHFPSVSSLQGIFGMFFPSF